MAAITENKPGARSSPTQTERSLLASVSALDRRLARGVGGASRTCVKPAGLGTGNDLSHHSFPASRLPHPMALPLP